MAQHEKLVILGSGPAGYTAALYAARANLSPLLFEGMQPGGQLTITSEVENYPGFPDGILGPELMELMKKQSERFRTRTVQAAVGRVDFSRRPFQLWQDDKLYTADAVIVATGASAKWLGIDSEKKYQGRGVSACATCDGFFYRGQDVAVIQRDDLDQLMFVDRDLAYDLLWTFVRTLASRLRETNEKIKAFFAMSGPGMG